MAHKRNFSFYKCQINIFGTVEAFNEIEYFQIKETTNGKNNQERRFKLLLKYS